MVAKISPVRQSTCPEQHPSALANRLPVRNLKKAYFLDFAARASSSFKLFVSGISSPPHLTQ